jgi:hypothetical protein
MSYRIGCFVAVLLAITINHYVIASKAKQTRWAALGTMCWMRTAVFVT